MPPHPQKYNLLNVAVHSLGIETTAAASAAVNNVQHLRCGTRNRQSITVNVEWVLLGWRNVRRSTAGLLTPYQMQASAHGPGMLRFGIHNASRGIQVGAALNQRSCAEISAHSHIFKLARQLQEVVHVGETISQRVEVDRRLVHRQLSQEQPGETSRAQFRLCAGHSPQKRCLRQ